MTIKKKAYSLILNSATVSMLTITALLESLNTLGGSSDIELLLLSLKSSLSANNF